MKILTFNWHESYIHLLSKTDYEFDVVEKWKGGRYGWIREFRPIPHNCHLISEDEAKIRLKADIYERTIAHNFNDLLFVYEFAVPKVLIFHNKLSCEIALGGNKVNREEYLRQVHQLFDATKNLTLVFISKAKMDDWGLDGEIILPGIDISEYGGYTGHMQKVLRVGNGLKFRDIMLGYSFQERILNGLPSTILGLNPDIPESIIPEGWDKLKEFMRSHRVYLNTTLEPYEDGYNLALLEAMAIGMPVVSIANTTSPIEDGINGYVSYNEAYLCSRIEELLRNHSLAKSLGQKARETVMEKFPIERFISNWRRILGRRELKGGAFSEERLKILMSYTSNPQTTAAYLEKALRKNHDVITFGPTIDDNLLKQWDLEKIKDRVKNHDIPYFTSDLKAVFEKLPSGWIPDLFLWVESGIWFDLDGIDNLPCFTACYLIDTHLHLDEHIEIAKKFRYVFIAQKEYIPYFKEKGIQNIFWLPLACDPEIHTPLYQLKGSKKLHDIGFVGSLTDPQRIKLLDKLKQRFNLYYERCFLERMAEVFSQSKIIFNNSVNNDLNMRVFEAMASGSMLLTDEAKGSGLTELFQDRKHLVIYRDEKELFELTGYYLRNDDERERIAEEGMREVLSKHTYEHRVKEMVDILSSFAEEKETSRDIENSYYRQERRDVEALIPDGAMRILDVGCGDGICGKRLLEKGAKEVNGIEIAPVICEKAKANLSRVICGDIEVIELPFDEGYFDCIVFADILEHLKEPLSMIKKLKRYLKDSGTIVASIPNVRYHGVINMLAEGHWRYEDYGILDRTHLRFFTKKEIEKLFYDAGLEITGITENIDHQYNNINPLSQGISFGRVTLSRLNPDELKDLFVIQYLIRSQKARYALNAESGSLEAQKTELEEYLYAHPADLNMLYKYAEICHKLGFKEKALESLERILIFEPEREDAIELREKMGDLK